MYRLLEKIHTKILFWLGFANPNIEKNGEKRVLSYILEKCNKSELVVFDVGANEGNYTKAVLEVIPSAKVFLFEPQRALFEKLKGRFQNCFNFGLSDKDESMSLYGTKDRSGLTSVYNRKVDHFSMNFEEKEKAEFTTLDSFCEKNDILNIDLLKLDVEGHELCVLKGGEKMLSNVRFIQFEFGGCNIDSRTFFRDFWYLLHDSFNIYRITSRGLKNIPVYREKDEIFLTSNYLAEKKI